MADRTNTQTLITLHADEALVNAAERCRKKKGVSRSQWIREAIREKAAREGIALPDEAALAPDRAGKGGQPTHQEKPVAQPAMLLTDADDGAPAGKAERKTANYAKKTAKRRKGD